MTRTETLLDLAAQLEQAPGPSRALDQQIELTRPGVLPHPDTLRPGYVVDEWAYVISDEDHPTEHPWQGYSAGRWQQIRDIRAGRRWNASTSPGIAIAAINVAYFGAQLARAL